MTARAIIWLTGSRDVEPAAVEVAVAHVSEVVTSDGRVQAVTGRHLPGGLKSGGFSIELAAPETGTLAGLLNSHEVQEALQTNAFRRHQVVTFDGAATAFRTAESGAGTGLVKRTLLVRVDEGAPAELVGEFERAMAAMPAYVDVILNWNFARLETGGPFGFTHVWEQEFAQLSDFTDAYFTHPYHWGVVNAWHDPQYPYAIVDPTAVAQGWYEVDTSVLRRLAVEAPR